MTKGDSDLASTAPSSAVPSKTVRDPQRCHACDVVIEGEPAARGYLLFVRGDRPVAERPPLCERCAHAIGMTALFRFWMEEEEG